VLRWQYYKERQGKWLDWGKLNALVGSMLFILQVVRVIEAFEMGFDRIQCKSLGKYFCTQNIFKNLRTTQCQCNYSDFKKSILYSVENVSDFYIISKRKTLIKYLSSKLQIYLIRCLYLDVS
jgi:hypothetical protein